MSDLPPPWAPKLTKRERDHMKRLRAHVKRLMQKAGIKVKKGK